MTGEVLLLVQATLCIGTGLAVSYLFSSRAARAHQVLLIGLVGAVVLPCLTLVVSHLGIGLFASETVTLPDVAAMAMEPAEAIGRVLYGPEMEFSPVVSTVAEPSPIANAVQGPAPAPLPWDTVLLACWMATTAVLLGRLVLRFILGLRLVRTSHDVHHEGLFGAAETARAKLEIPRSVHVRSGKGISTPLLWGWTREPVVLVPMDAGQRAAHEDWVGLFCHELAHWKRLDHLSSLFAELVTCVFPWHPLVWWARTRLMRLSEHVCDDWVLACGRPGVDYAELLLGLSPQRPITFVPAIVGKGHTMKERIRRIVAEQCGDPRVGRSWTLGLAVLATMVVVGAAFAQTRPAGPDGRPPQEQRQRLEQQKLQDLAMVGRRNVLKRMLEPLREQIREVERVLAERPEGMGEEGQILRSEREALREQIERLERQLRDLDRGPMMPQPVRAVGPRPGEIERHLAELTRFRNELTVKAERTEQELQGLGDNQGERTRELQDIIRQIREQIRAIEGEMANLQRATAEAGHLRAMEGAEQARMDVERARMEAQQMARQAEEQAERLQDLRQRAAEIQGRFQGLEDKEGDEARALREELNGVREQIAGTERQMQEFRRQREGAEQERLRAERGLRGEMGEPRRQSLQQDPMRRIPDQIRQPGMEGLPSREVRPRGVEARMENPDGQVVTVYKLKNANPEQLAGIVRPLTAGRVAADERTGSLIVSTNEANRARIENIIKELDVPQVGPRQNRPEAGQGLQTQVADLRSQVKGLNEKMLQMQRLLEQLLQQRPEANQMQELLERLLRQNPELRPKPGSEDIQP